MSPRQQEAAESHPLAPEAPVLPVLRHCSISLSAEPGWGRGFARCPALGASDRRGPYCHGSDLCL